MLIDYKIILFTENQMRKVHNQMLNLLVLALLPHSVEYLRFIVVTPSNQIGTIFGFEVFSLSSRTRKISIKSTRILLFFISSEVDSLKHCSHTK